jgi:hypothetical protein
MKRSLESISYRLFVVALLTAANVTAQNTGFIAKSSVAISLAPVSDEVSAASVSPILGARYTFTNGFHFEAQAGLTALRLNRIGYGSTNNVRVGNPILAGGYRWESIDGQKKYEVNLRTGIPLATFPGKIPDNRLVEFNYNNANCAYGWKDPYLWLMNVLPIVINAQVAGAVTNNFTYDVCLSPAYLVSVNSRPSRFAISATAELDYTISDIHLRAGAASFFSGLSLENNDCDQHSLWIGSNIHFLDMETRIDVHLNVDQPNGILSTGPKPTWGVAIQFQDIPFR